MRFLLHPIRRSAQCSSAVAGNRRAAYEKATLTRPAMSPRLSPPSLPSSSSPSSSVMAPKAPAIRAETRNDPSNKSSSNLTKSWGQQCSPECGCVLRFETTVDRDTKEIVSATYVAKTVVTTVDRETGRLEPVYAARTRRPMLQECACPSLHALARQVTAYLPHQRMDRVRNMNQFTYTRASPAFRHAVLAEHGLPRSDTHCFDVLEEAFCGAVDGSVPSRRRLDAEFGRLLAAECLQVPLVVRCQQTRQMQYAEHHSGGGGIGRRDPRRRGRVSPRAAGAGGNGGIGTDRNRLSMTTPRTASTLRMFDINAEYWDEEEYTERAAASLKSNGRRFDWVSYVDEMYENEESA